jgi:hypothetical protein
MTGGGALTPAMMRMLRHGPAAFMLTAALIQAQDVRAGDPGEGGMRATPVQVRVANLSDVDLERVVVKFPSQEEDYGRIPAGGRTEYREIGEAYRYAHVVAGIDGRTVELQPMDYVGEKPIAPGNYTYELSYNPAASPRQQLQLSLVAE